MNIKNVSKTRLRDYEKCPLMLYKKLRDNEPYTESVQLQIGIMANELAKKKIAESAGKKYEVHNIEDRFSLVVVDKVLNIIENKNIESYYTDLQVIAIDESVAIQMDNIEKGFMFSAKLDVVSFTEINNQKYVVVDELKSGQAIKRETDIDSIMGAYAAHEHYGGLPVIFRRIALSSNLIFIDEFSIERIERLKPFIYFKTKELKEDMESDLIPCYKPGNHCLYCKYIHSCQGRKNISSLQNKFKAAIWAEMYAKKYKKEVKNAATELLKYIPINEEAEETVLLPFLNGRYGAVAKTTESWQLKGRSIKKNEILKVLIETGEINDFIDNIELKFNETLAKKLENEYKVPMKKVVKQVVSLIEVNGEENEFE